MLAATIPAHATSGNNQNDDNHADSDNHEDHDRDDKVKKVVTPEMEPALGVGALVLISGGIMVIRGRRKE